MDLNRCKLRAAGYSALHHISGKTSISRDLISLPSGRASVIRGIICFQCLTNFENIIFTRRFLKMVPISSHAPCNRNSKDQSDFNPFSYDVNLHLIVKFRISWRFETSTPARIFWLSPLSRQQGVIMCSFYFNDAPTCGQSEHDRKGWLFPRSLPHASLFSSPNAPGLINGLFCFVCVCGFLASPRFDNFLQVLLFS